MDHFRPASRFRKLRHSYPNFYWACPTCNRRKLGAWPTQAEEDLGYCFPDPAVTGLGNHVRVDGDAVVAMSRQGEYLIEEVGLNSDTHRYRRRARRERNEAIAQVCAVIAALEQAAEPVQLEQLTKLRTVLAELSARSGPVPFDPVRVCSCVALQ